MAVKAIVERLDCDVDYEAEAEAWLSKLIDLTKDDFSADPQAAVAAQTGAAVQGVVAQPHQESAV